MHMEDVFSKVIDELNWINELVDEVTRVEIEPKGGMITDGIQGAPGRHEVVGNFSRVNLQTKLDAILGEYIHDRFPAGSKICIAFIDIILIGWREEIQVLPYRTAGESVDNIHPKFLGSNGSIFHFFGAAPAYTFGIPISPQPRR